MATKCLQKSSFPAVDVRLDVLFDLMFLLLHFFVGLAVFFVVSDFTVWSFFFLQLVSFFGSFNIVRQATTFFMYFHSFAAGYLQATATEA